uniref:Putative portal protein n=1 Tax=viral metagenome TaxID=1070528 RepID=A0A6M3L1C7_9ZZZZ
MIGLARETVGLGLAASEFHSRFYGDGTHPSVIVTIPPEVNLGDSEKEYKERLKMTISGLKNAHGVAVFANGETANRLTMPLKDAQFVESTQANDMKICGFYHVPPHKAALFSKNTNRNNMEQENQSYVDSCLIHWTTRWEQAISHQLLTPEERRDGLFFEFNLSGLLKGDTEARGEFYKTLFNMGYPLNRILAKENENPVEGGDEGYIQLNMIPISKSGDLADKQIEGGNDNEGASVRRFAEKRSLLVRDRLARQYHPLFLRAAEKIVNRERLAVKREIGKQEKERAKSDMETWLNNFYRALPEYIKTEIGPVFQSFARAVADASAEEIGVDLDESEIARFTGDYIERYAQRHAGGSLGQLTAILRDKEKELSDLEVRVDEWGETRAEKIATNETVRGSNAIFQLAAFSAGLGTFWRIRGAKTCPYCKELNGRRVRSGESFVNDGDELNPEGGTGPMKIRGMKAHPPLHQGCDCYLSV